ncbi:RNA polymerase subunit sigma-70 [Micromonospora andamanensis]|uniref:RNA polymerase sigma factor n=1 Tax=Micromonospora andamanensis TaxID=1287068 RepID=A0ABQ4I5J3_9ACTN|nr:RNA polymerase subunit sigma-70 [Micromonospora andamanensis]GIJ13162.1 RNA polymerase sigma factor [Micromonospora andamanensis]
METDHSAAGRPADPAGDRSFSELNDRHRHELRVHCYRMLGSFEDAEDLVQETFLRAWRRRDDLELVENVRAWLYRIATNACLDAIKAKGRRVHELESFRDIPWLEPYPDVQMAPADNPHAAVVERETIELTFLAVLQLLPPRQRAALILRDVLAWPVGDVGGLLELSTAAVNSALQRARATLREHHPIEQRETWTAASPSADERAVLDRYIRAYEAGDTSATLALLAEDVRVTMPPAPFLFEGRDAIMGLAERARSTGTWRLVATSANRQPAAACYLQDPDTGQFRAFKLDVLRTAGPSIAEITTFGDKHFPAFGLPQVLA